MCGIIGGVTNSNITPLLIEGLNKLEYRGYDSSGLIVLTDDKNFDRARSVGKVKNLEKKLNKRSKKIVGNIGIAHTRWATHGEPSSLNAHPHISKIIHVASFSPDSIELGSIPLSNLNLASVLIFNFLAVFLIESGSK